MATVTNQLVVIAVALLQLCNGDYRSVVGRSESYFETMKEQIYTPSRIVPPPQNDGLTNRDLGCPPEDIIEPCICTMDFQMNLMLDCSDVESEGQLADVLAQDFAFPHFLGLTIAYNNKLKVLRNGVFGNNTFEKIYIGYGVLEEVEHNTFARSYHTTDDVNFVNNRLRMFPFNEITNFSKLKYLSVYDNDLISFPTIASSSLKVLDLSYNDFHYDGINSEALQQLPKLEYISVSGSGLRNINEGTFTRLPHLTRVFLDGNRLTHIPSGAVDLNDNPHSLVSLWGNEVENMGPNAVNGVKNYLDMESNDLTELEEAVWRPHLEQGVRLYLSDNPLECGCDIAWLIQNDTFMGLIDEDVTCSDGILLSSLDPGVFAENC